MPSVSENGQRWFRLQKIKENKTKMDKAVELQFQAQYPLLAVFL